MSVRGSWNPGATWQRRQLASAIIPGVWRTGARAGQRFYGSWIQECWIGIWQRPKRALTRIHSLARQRGKKSEWAADPGLMTKQFVKEGADVPLGGVVDRCGLDEEATLAARADYSSYTLARMMRRTRQDRRNLVTGLTKSRFCDDIACSRQTRKCFTSSDRCDNLPNRLADCNV
jgi:hypothetical protein